MEEALLGLGFAADGALRLCRIGADGDGFLPASLRKPQSSDIDIQPVTPLFCLAGDTPHAAPQGRQVVDAVGGTDSGGAFRWIFPALSARHHRCGTHFAM